MQPQCYDLIIIIVLIMLVICVCVCVCIWWCSWFFLQFVEIGCATRACRHVDLNSILPPGGTTFLVKSIEIHSKSIEILLKILPNSKILSNSSKSYRKSYGIQKTFPIPWNPIENQMQFKNPFQSWNPLENSSLIPLRLTGPAPSLILNSLTSPRSMNFPTIRVSRSWNVKFATLGSTPEHSDFFEFTLFGVPQKIRRRPLNG